MLYLDGTHRWILELVRFVPVIMVINIQHQRPHHVLPTQDADVFFSPLVNHIKPLLNGFNNIILGKVVNLTLSDNPISLNTGEKLWL